MRRPLRRRRSQPPQRACQPGRGTGLVARHGASIAARQGRPRSRSQARRSSRRRTLERRSRSLRFRAWRTRSSRPSARSRPGRWHRTRPRGSSQSSADLALAKHREHDCRIRRRERGANDRGRRQSNRQAPRARRSPCRGTERAEHPQQGDRDGRVAKATQATFIPPSKRIRISATTAIRSTSLTPSTRLGQMSDTTAAARRNSAGAGTGKNSVSFAAPSAKRNAAATTSTTKPKWVISVNYASSSPRASAGIAPREARTATHRHPYQGLCAAARNVSM